MVEGKINRINGGTFMLKTIKSNKGFSLVELMIVVAIIVLLAKFAVPELLRARKRSQASRVVNNLRLIDSAVDQYAIEKITRRPLQPSEPLRGLPI